MISVIFCGGYGTRMNNGKPGTLKPLIEVAGKAILLQTKFKYQNVSLNAVHSVKLYIDSALNQTITFKCDNGALMYVLNTIDFVYNPIDNSSHTFSILVNVNSPNQLKFDSYSYISYQIIQLT